MTTEGAENERATNRLVRAIAADLFARDPTPEQIYFLCRLTWITKSTRPGEPSYLRSIKLPALAKIFERDYGSLEEAADDIARRLRRPRLKPLLAGPTGFTNTYNAYRNTARSWIAKRFDLLMPLFRAAYAARSDADRQAIAAAIDHLPGIPSPHRKKGALRPEHFLTPVFFALDERICFPIINGRPSVQRLLKSLGLSDASIEEQATAMMKLIGHPGIRDAADLDHPRNKGLPDKISDADRKARQTSLRKKARDLRSKDTADILVINAAHKAPRRRLHNEITNKLLKWPTTHRVTEGDRKDLLFDACILDYNGRKQDLLIEAKSSAEMAEVRMAIGQLCSYWLSKYGTREPHLAVLLPEPPSKAVQELLDWRNIGVPWFSGHVLKTASPWLSHLTEPQ
jgi:hypothetical protein